MSPSPSLPTQARESLRERREQQALDRLKAELARAFVAPEATCKSPTAADGIARKFVSQHVV